MTDAITASWLEMNRAEEDAQKKKEEGETKLAEARNGRRNRFVNRLTKPRRASAKRPARPIPTSRRASR